MHEIKVDFNACIKKAAGGVQRKQPTASEIDALCRTLCDMESTYLNINIISKTQVSSNIWRKIEI